MIYGQAITMGGGIGLNIDYGLTAPDDTSKLWVPLEKKPSYVEVNGEFMEFGQEVINQNNTKHLPQVVARPFSACVDGIIYTIGGLINYNNPSSYSNNDVYAFNPATGVVTTDATVSNYIYRCNGCAYGKALYVSKEDMDSNGNFHTYKYDINARTLTRVIYSKSMAVRALHPVGNYIYMLVGTGVYKYDPSTDTYTALSLSQSLPFTCGQGTVSCCYQGKIYILSYGNYISGSPKVTIVDITTGAVTITSTPVLDCREAGCCMYGQYAYIFGGFSKSSDKQINTIRVFDTQTLTTRVLTTTLPVTAKNTAPVLYGTSIYLIGGENYGDSAYPSAHYFLDTILKFDVETLLAEGHLKVFTDMYGKTTALINEKKVKLFATVRNAYIGNEDGYARVADAYVYDEANSEWQALDGSSVT